MVTITIANTDRTDWVDWGSLRIDNILTNQVDRCTFVIRNPDLSGGTFKPTVGNEVIITDGSSRIFGGLIVRLTESSPSPGIIEYAIECSDFTRVLDQHLVAETYENMTVGEVINQIITDYTTGITTVQVDCTISVKSIRFKYEPVSDCIKQLSELVNYDWYLDYEKDLYFKSPQATLAPFSINDNDGSHDWSSLVIRRDNSQKRNSVYVRGGEYVGTEFTAEVEADGSQITFNLPYKFQDFEASLTGSPLSLGVDPIHNPDNYDALYNFQEKIVKFKNADKPTAGSILRYSGKPYLPVVVKVRNSANIADTLSAEGQGDGEYQFIIIDKSITSLVEARQRAAAEIITYGETLSEGEFNTETSGLKAGQRITINSAMRNVNEDFIINKVTSKMVGPDRISYSVSLITTKTMDFINLMKKFLQKGNKEIVVTDTELLDLTESVSRSIDISSTVTVHPVNFGTRFVLGPWIPTSDGRRQFIIEGSTFTA